MLSNEILHKADLGIPGELPILFQTHMQGSGFLFNSWIDKHVESGQPHFTATFVQPTYRLVWWSSNSKDLPLAVLPVESMERDLIRRTCRWASIEVETGVIGGKTYFLIVLGCPDYWLTLQSASILYCASGIECTLLQVRLYLLSSQQTRWYKPLVKDASANIGWTAHQIAILLTVTCNNIQSTARQTG